MKHAMYLAAAAMLTPLSATAQVTEPDAIAVDDFPESKILAQSDWRIDAAGSVRLVRNTCPRCAGFSVRTYEFAVEPAHYRRIADLLPNDLVSAALGAPCTLPHATYGWLRPVNLVIRTANSERHIGYVRECRSAELDLLRERLASATAIIVELARTHGGEGM